MKYVMGQAQTASLSGHISDPKYANMVKNNYVDLTDGEFLKFEHTDGLNYVNLGLEYNSKLLNKNYFDAYLAYGAGAGFLLPKTNSTLIGKERSDRFNLAGLGADLCASLNVVIYNHIMLRAEGKLGYIDMPDIKTTLNNHPYKASQDFTFDQFNFGIGYTFSVCKNK